MNVSDSLPLTGVPSVGLPVVGAEQDKKPQQETQVASSRAMTVISAVGNATLSGGRMAVRGTAYVVAPVLANSSAVLVYSGLTAAASATATAGALTAGGLAAAGAAGVVASGRFAQCMWRGDGIGHSLVEAVKAPVVLGANVVSTAMDIARHRTRAKEVANVLDNLPEIVLDQIGEIELAALSSKPESESAAAPGLKPFEVVCDWDETDVVIV